MCDAGCDENRNRGTKDKLPYNTGNGETDGGKVSLGEVLDSLTSSRRRIILYYLRDNEIADVDELATQIAARESDIPPHEVPSDRCDHIAALLVHTELPKLADTDLIEYDRRSNTARYSHPPSILDKVLPLLAQLEGKQRE